MRQPKSMRHAGGLFSSREFHINLCYK